MKKKDNIVKGIVNSVLPVVLAFASWRSSSLPRSEKVRWKLTGY